MQERQGFRFGLGCTMGSMCITLSLLLVFQLSHRGWAVADDLSSYINQKEDQVRQIADEIGRLNARKCELVAQCSSSCSRHSCSPIGELDNSDMYKLGCQETQKNPFCSVSGDHSVDCNHHRVNYAMSYIRLPPNMSTSGVIPPEMCSSICMTKHLEEIFYKFGEFSKDDAFYFGSIDGTQRMYPGQEQNHSTCFNFDPRKRPWFTSFPRNKRGGKRLPKLASKAYQPRVSSSPSSTKGALKRLIQIRIAHHVTGPKLSAPRIVASPSLSSFAVTNASQRAIITRHGTPKSYCWYRYCWQYCCCSLPLWFRIAAKEEDGHTMQYGP